MPCPSNTLYPNIALYPGSCGAGIFPVQLSIILSTAIGGTIALSTANQITITKRGGG